MSDQKILKFILVLLLPPVAVYRHWRKFGFWFWVDLILWLPTAHLGSMLIAAVIAYCTDPKPDPNAIGTPDDSR